MFFCAACAIGAHAIDIGAQIPHAALRTYVMGKRGAANEPASPAELDEMAETVVENAFEQRTGEARLMDEAEELVGLSNTFA